MTDKICGPNAAWAARFLKRGLEDLSVVAGPLDRLEELEVETFR